MKPFHQDRTPWDDDRVAALKKYWRQGYSAAQIANLLGGVTRNAVIGKVHRLGLMARHAPTRNVLSSRQQSDRRKQNHVRRTGYSAAKLAALVSPRAVAAPSVSVLALNVSLLALQPGMCKWPTGENGTHTFCGHAWTGEHGPYCAAHAAIAYVPTVHKVRPPREPRRKSPSIDWLEAA